METSSEFADMQHTSNCWGEANDCSVKAMAIALDIRYADAWYTTRRHGREYQEGMDIADFLIAILSKHKHIKQLEYTGSVQDFLLENRTGTFILEWPLHVHVYKDGAMHDNTQNWLTHVLKVWQIL